MLHPLITMLLCSALVGHAWAGTADQDQAREVAGVNLPACLHRPGQPLLLNGAGLRRIMLLKVYVAALYLPRHLHDAHTILDQDMPRLMQLTLLRDLTTDQNVEALKGGLEANNSERELAALAPEVERFLGYIRSLHAVPAGTVIQLDYLPGAGTRVTVGHRLLGTVPGEAFNRAVLRIWLGEEPVQTSLKKALLGEG
ncbi:MAG: chalcone isomerase family protein [Pseudomonadota bacterium]